MIETLIFSNIKFNNNDTIFLGLACVSRNDVVVLDKFDANGVPVFCRKQSMWMQEDFWILQFLLATNSIDIVAGDFNFDLLKFQKINCFRR